MRTFLCGLGYLFAAISISLGAIHTRSGAVTAGHIGKFEISGILKEVNISNGYFVLMNGRQRNSFHASKHVCVRMKRYIGRQMIVFYDIRKADSKISVKMIWIPKQSAVSASESLFAL